MVSSPSATSLSRLTILNSLRKILVNPRLGMRRCSGIWPPSKPRIMREPLRERLAFMPARRGLAHAGAHAAANALFILRGLSSVLVR